MDNIHPIDHFMAGIATVGNLVDGAKGAESQGFALCVFEYGLPIFAIASLSPGIKAQLLYSIARLISNDIDTAQMIFSR